MKKVFVKAGKKDSLFVFQFGEGVLKLAVFASSAKAKSRLPISFEAVAVSPVITDKELREALRGLFSRAGFNANPVIVCLPRGKATMRYLRIPTRPAVETENMVSLQAARFLPYSPQELVSGYQLVSSDKEGFSGVSLAIVHRDIIAKQIEILSDLNVSSLKIVVSSYGLSSLYAYLKPQEERAVFVLDCELPFIEAAVVCAGRLLFSRSFKIDTSASGWEDVFTAEITKTKDAYVKEVPSGPAVKSFMVSGGKAKAEVVSFLKSQAALPVDILSCASLQMPQELSSSFEQSGYSFVSLLGLGLVNPAETLSLSPPEVKQKNKKSALQKQRLLGASCIAATVLMFALGAFKHLDNKAAYITRLKKELQKTSASLGPFEEIEKKLSLMSSGALRKSSVIEVVYEVYRIVPSGISLTALGYDEAQGIVLRGQARELQPVLGFVSQLGKSKAFEPFEARIKYATKRASASGEVIDFEIACVKK